MSLLEPWWPGPGPAGPGGVFEGEHFHGHGSIPLPVFTRVGSLQPHKPGGDVRLESGSLNTWAVAAFMLLHPPPSPRPRGLLFFIFVLLPHSPSSPSAPPLLLSFLSLLSLLLSSFSSSPLCLLDGRPLATPFLHSKTKLPSDQGRETQTGTLEMPGENSRQETPKVQRGQAGRPRGPRAWDP